MDLIYQLLILLAALGSVEMNSIHRRNSMENLDLSQLCCPSSLKTIKRSIGTLSEHTHRHAYVS